MRPYVLRSVCCACSFRARRLSALTTAPASLARDQSIEYAWWTPYSSVNGSDAEAHRLWEAIDIDTGVLAIPDAWARDHDLPLAVRFPWDDTKGLYLVAAYHNLHCLVRRHR